jgi:hypothetical protein
VIQNRFRYLEPADIFPNSLVALVDEIHQQIADPMAAILSSVCGLKFYSYFA